MLQYWWLLIPLGLVGLYVAFFVLVVVASMWEKRQIVAYVVPEPGQELPPTDYARNTNAVASQSGWLNYGVFHDGKSGMYRVRYDFWLAPDRSTLAVVGGGLIARMPVNAIWIVSPTGDGRYLVTTDWNGEADLSRLADIEICRDVGTVFLLSRHQHRVKTSPSGFKPLGEEPLADYLQMRQRQVQQLVANGDARYLDAEQLNWKYTPKGALRFALAAICGIGPRPKVS